MLLIPIDHGMSLPSSFEFHEEDYCWLSWPQCENGMSEKMEQYIASINVDKDIEMLRCNFHISDASLVVFKVLNSLLVKGAKRGLSLKEMAKIWCRKAYEDAPSRLELLVSESTKFARELEGKDNLNESDDVRWLKCKKTTDLFTIIDYKLSQEIDSIIRAKNV